MLQTKYLSIYFQKIVLLIAIINHNVSCSFAVTINYPKDVPNPMVHPELCGRTNVPRSQICDVDSLLTTESKNVIEGYINSNTKAQIAVVVISKMTSIFVGHKDIEDAAESFAIQLHNIWGVGDVEAQNGILVFLSINDRAIYFSVSDGLRGKLSRRIIDSIINHMKPSLRAHNYGEAVERALIEIDLILSGKPSQLSRSTDEDALGNFSGLIIFGVIIAIGLSLAFLEGRKVRRLKVGQEALNRLMKEVSDPSASRFSSKTCPICLEEFPSTEIPNVINVPPVETSLGSTGHSINLDAKPTTESTTSSTTTNGDSSDPKRPMALQCGHMFCYTCLKAYLMEKAQVAGGAACPICREPVEGRTGPRPQEPPPRPPRPGFPTPGTGSSATSNPPYDSDNPSCSTSYAQTNPSYSSSQTPFSSTASSSSTNNHIHMHHLAAEILFRVNRMRILYPEVMTAQTHTRLQDSLSRGAFHEFQAAAQTRLNEVNRTLTDITARRAAANSGSRGASRSSWGGGGSSGGGGGRW